MRDTFDHESTFANADARQVLFDFCVPPPSGALSHPKLDVLRRTFCQVKEFSIIGFEAQPAYVSPPKPPGGDDRSPKRPSDFRPGEVGSAEGCMGTAKGGAKGVNTVAGSHAEEALGVSVPPAFPRRFGKRG